MTESLDDIEDERLADRMADFGLLPMAEVPLRTRVLVGGEVQGLQVVPRSGSPWLEVTVGDGTGRVVAVFTGRRRLGGVYVGRRILIDGVVRPERTRKVVMNPAYTIVE